MSNFQKKSKIKAVIKIKETLKTQKYVEFVNNFFFLKVNTLPLILKKK